MVHLTFTRVGATVLLCGLVVIHGGDAKWAIKSHSPDQDVLLGQSITLMCRAEDFGVTANGNWKTCLWRREGDGVDCLMEYKCVKHCGSLIFSEVWGVDVNCEAGLKDATYFGSDPNTESHICGLVIPKAGPEDNTRWTCNLEECKTIGGCHARIGSGTYAVAHMNVTVHQKP